MATQKSPLEILNEFNENGTFYAKQKHYDLATKVLALKNVSQIEQDQANWIIACFLSPSKFMQITTDDVSLMVNALSK